MRATTKRAFVLPTSIRRRGLFLSLAGLAAVAGAGAVESRLPEGFVRGVNYAHVHRQGRGYGSEVSARELGALRSIGVDWIAITPFGYQDRADADRIYGFPGAPGRSEFFRGTDPTMSDTAILREISGAHRLGLRVLLKPQMWSRDYWDGREWHGTIRQDSPEAHRRWWASYRAFILHYARVARAGGADGLAIGTELVGMTTRYPREWRALARDVRRAAPGLLLTYSAHWETEFETISFWNDLDWIGVGTYFPLDAPDGASVEELIRAWAPHRARLSRVAVRAARPIVFTEVGYRPTVGAHRRPWEYGGGTPDEEAQSRAYEALFRALGDAPWWRGTFLWKAFTDPAHGAGPREADGFSFRGRAAEAVVRRWYGETREDP